MSTSLKISGLGLVAIIFVGLIVIAGAGWKLNSFFGGSKQVISATPIGLPIIMRTSGGLLEVATVTINERIQLTDTRKLLGLDLGETVSQIDVPATYKYNIELAPEWKMEVRGKTCFVVSPPIKASLPVAIDTTQMQKHTQGGWGRFNKKKNLENLEKMISPELEKRARSATNFQATLEPARKTVTEFVTKWLIKEQQWKLDPEYQVKVSFSDESAVH